MGSTKRISSIVVVVALASALVVMLAVPAGARVAQKNTEFCEILSSDQGAGIDFEGLEPPEAEYAATLVRKLAKTGVPAKLKKDLKRLAKDVYDRIAAGESENEVTPEQLSFVQSALTRFSKYVGKNCVPAVPST